MPRAERVGREANFRQVNTPDQLALWVLRAQCDDRDALELVLRSIQSSLHRYLSRLVGSTEVDDVLQNVLVLVYRKLHLLAAPELFRPWVFRIAHREAIRYLKRRKRWPEQMEEDTDAFVPAAGQTLAQPAEEILHELLGADALSPASRAVLVLHFEEELTLPEVAAILDLPLGTVKSRLAYGLAALRSMTKKGSTHK